VVAVGQPDRRSLCESAQNRNVTPTRLVGLGRSPVSLHRGTSLSAHGAEPHGSPAGARGFHASVFRRPVCRPGGQCSNPPQWSILLSTDIAGDRTGPGWSVGASICGAVESLTRALAVELAPIRVNAVSPGLIRTPLWARMPVAEREQMFSSAAGKIPAGRVGEPQDIADAFAFLMNQRFATGSIITVDGGAVLV
jgi:NAD(P)-dependent dehydrogenase (short-subunit alcohol dehydrogenase family)